MTEHRFSLEKYAGPQSRHICPSCKRLGQFTRYVDNQTGRYIADTVGMCNRRDECGYHMPPRKHFGENGGNPYKENYPSIVREAEDYPINYVPNTIFRKTLGGWLNSNLAQHFIRIFGIDLAQAACTEYFVGQSDRDKKNAIIYWQVDYDGNVRTGKSMCYHSETGKRKKEVGFEPKWIHKLDTLPQPFNYQQCFYGEHLLKKFPTKKVNIVESEKTAIIASVYMPEFIWLATGGVAGVKWQEKRVNQVLLNRDITLFPDFGFFNKAKGITCYEKWREIEALIKTQTPCKINVSRLLEDNIDESERTNGYDLADFLIKIDDKTDRAVNSNGIPIKEVISFSEWWARFTNT